MRKLFLVVMLTVGGITVFGQKSIDALFEKYAGKDGFTTVTINGSLLNFAGCVDKSVSDLPADITEIRILSQEDKSLNVGNFYDLVIQDIDLNLYEEFMRVKESDQEMRMLVRMEGKNFKEFLLIVGGNDNSIIQIKGNMNMDEARKFSEGVKTNNGGDFVLNAN